MTVPLISVVGGFLGAGKTTLLVEAALRLGAQGRRVAIVTNDQGNALVDTQWMADRGLSVAEVPNGCFCCRFDEFVHVTKELDDRHRPDVIFAEAVGSCADLSATVYQPIKEYYAERFRLAPLSIVVDPSRFWPMVTLNRALPSSSIAYLYRKQMAEADILIVNKVDLVDEDKVTSFIDSVQPLAPGAKVVRISAKTGLGVDSWLTFLSHRHLAGQKILDLDYETYSEAEASLGWLNASVHLRAVRSFSPTKWATEFFRSVNERLSAQHAETGHVKLFLKSAAGTMKASLVETGTSPTVERDISGDISMGRVLINARVNMTPDLLEEIVRQSVTEAGDASGTVSLVEELHSFTPPRPKPTYRFSQPVQPNG